MYAVGTGPTRKYSSYHWAIGENTNTPWVAGEPLHMHGANWTLRTGVQLTGVQFSVITRLSEEKGLREGKRHNV
jgi:hypothetical protein